MDQELFFVFVAYFWLSVSDATWFENMLFDLALDKNPLQICR